MTTAALASPAPNQGRITARMPLAVQKTLELAAGLMGATLNQFVVQTALREAERIIDQEQTIRLNSRATQAFLTALDNPAPPNAALAAALADHAAQYDDKTGTLGWAPQPRQF